jgi:hypothetical protein
LIERGEVELNDAWFADFKKQLSKDEVWREYWTKQSVKNNAGGVPGAAVDKVPAVPYIDAKKLFWRMMRISRAPDPHMYPALKALRQSRKFVLGALSNTVHFPTGIVDDEGTVFDRSLIHEPHPSPYADDSKDIRDCFDMFLSSAHIGLRKPDPKAYELAVKELGKIAEEKGLGNVEAGDVLFLDDIGVNLKFARQSGLRTIKVDLGKTEEAVRKLEGEVELSLGNDGIKSKL